MSDTNRPPASHEPTRAERLQQFLLIYDYVKFHIGLYIATPPIIVIVAEGLGVEKTNGWFGAFVTLMIVIFLISGVHAGRCMSRWINEQWTDKFLEGFESEAFKMRRRHLHHSLYWLGLILGLVGVAIGALTKHGSRLVAWFT